MEQVIAYLIALAITFPFVITLTLYYGVKYFVKNKKRAIHLSMEYSAIFYVIATVYIFQETFNQQIIGVLILTLLITLLLFIILQWMLIGDIIIKRVWQLYLRTLFLIFFPLNITVIILTILLSLKS
ncbi:DUF3397 family protein [Amphibacillus cookii]|uniref:DUF3397 family protein n=1 Tax=Amphibacillus cookii TaxID=767787 RepID=UPI00195B64DC|nr:DUF3397 family protein [Amphibacillus cookii]MBM7540468.1 hypothetical protein [Amphibacillus cookii]